MLSAALSSEARVCTVRVPAGMRSNSSVAPINSSLLFTLFTLCYVFGEAPETRVDDDQITSTMSLGVVLLRLSFDYTEHGYSQSQSESRYVSELRVRRVRSQGLGAEPGVRGGEERTSYEEKKPKVHRNQSHSHPTWISSLVLKKNIQTRRSC